MMEILTKPKVIELSKLYDAMIQFRFARSRLKKYGHAEPEPSQLFETLKVAASALTEKEPELQFRFQHYLMKHSSVNGLVNIETVQEMYDMIVENARIFWMYPRQQMLKRYSRELRIGKGCTSRLYQGIKVTYRVLIVDLRTIGLRIVHKSLLFSDKYLNRTKGAHRSRVCRVRLKERFSLGPYRSRKGKAKAKVRKSRMTPEPGLKRVKVKEDFVLEQMQWNGRILIQRF